MKDLFKGHGSIQGITSVYAQKSGEVLLWTRNGEEVDVIKESFRPFILVTDKVINHDLPYCNIIRLNGDLDYKWKIEILHYRLFEKAFISHYNSIFNTEHKNIGTRLKDVKRYTFTEQYLIQSGNTYYKGLAFNDVVRMQIDIETTGSLEDADSKLFMIAIRASNGFEQVIHGDDERILLNQLNYFIKKVDPDIIENHYIFGFDIPFILKRARVLNVKVQFGRLPGLPFAYDDIYKYGDKLDPFKRYCVHGREIIDTLHASKKFEADTKKLENKFSLKHVAKVLRVNRQGDELYIDGSKIWETYKKDPERVIEYARYDVREVDEVSKKLNQSRFFLSQLSPVSFEKICTGGPTRVIENILVREYLRNGHSLPKPMSREGAKENKGGVSEVLETGLFENVIKLDVASMYPNIIVANNLGPHQDPLNIYIPLLDNLKKTRITYKEKAKSDPTYIPIQSALKIIINGSYGYLGCSHGLFNNPDNAARTTEIGREIILSIKSGIEKHGGRPLEIDTDGIICKFPHQSFSPQEFNDLVQKELIHYPYMEIEPEPNDGVIDIVYIYKKKCYAHLYNGKLKIVGTAFNNRALEKVFQNYIKESLSLLLHKDFDGLESIYQSLKYRIENREIESDEIKKSVRMKVSLSDYMKTKKKYTAHYDLWIESGILDVPAGTTTEFYKLLGKNSYKLASSYEHDYDVQHYLKLLETKKSLFDRALESCAP